MPKRSGATSPCTEPPPPTLPFLLTYPLPVPDQHPAPLLASHSTLNFELHRQHAPRRQRQLHSIIPSHSRRRHTAPIMLCRRLRNPQDLPSPPGHLHDNSLRCRIAIHKHRIPRPIQSQARHGHRAVWQHFVGDIIPHRARADELREMPEDPKALGEVKLVVLRGGVVGIDVEKRIVVPSRAAEGGAACGVGRGGAGHHVADGGPEVPGLGIDERQPLPDVARHVERAVDGGVPLRSFHDAGSRPAPGLVQVVGGFECGDLSHLDCRWGVRGGQILNQDGVVGECGIIRPIVHVR